VPTVDSTSFGAVSTLAQDPLKHRDGYKCWVCGLTDQDVLDVAHILPRSDVIRVTCSITYISSDANLSPIIVP
jgi:5-methylcytosine-specific restriction endonuclease McrA